MASQPEYLYITVMRAVVRFCRVEVRLTVDDAVSAAAGTREVGLGDRGCDLGPQCSGIRFTCTWIMPRRPSGHLDRRIAAKRVRAAAVTRMYQRGRPPPLPGIGVDGGRRGGRVWQRAGHMRAMTSKAGGSGLEVAAVAADPGHAGKFGVVKANERKTAKR